MPACAPRIRPGTSTACRSFPRNGWRSAARRAGRSCTTPARSSSRTDRSAELDADASVDGDAAFARCMADHRVEVELDHLGDDLDQRGDAAQQLDEGGAIGRRGTAEAVEQLAAVELVEHVGGVAVADRRDAERDVLVELDGDAAHAGDEDRPERGVLDHADEGLDAGADLALDDVAFEAGEPGAHRDRGGDDGG